jgi:transposase
MGRLEILTSRERRRHWSDRQKLDILSDVVTSGRSIVEIARQYDIVPQQIYGWRKQLAARQQSAKAAVTFLPVSMASSEAESAGDLKSERLLKPVAPTRPLRSPRIEIGCKGGRLLKVDSGIELERLKALIRLVEAA